MSHFTVAVFSRSPDDVETMLDPFYEGVDCNSEYAEFVEDDGCDYDERAGAKGYWCNPSAKWDWYSIGGRWSGLLRLKNSDNTVDSARVLECDFSPDKEEYDQAVRFWEVVVDGQPLRDGEKEEDFSSWYKPQYFIDQYRTKENYAEQLSMFSTYAFLTADGEWNEPGEMGWFGFADTTADSRDAYNKAFDAYLKQAHNEDLFITIVDCHI